jgi:hypothetical protein
LSFGFDEASAECAVYFAGLVDDGPDAGLAGRRTFGLQNQGHGENPAAVDKFHNGLTNIFSALMAVHPAFLNLSVKMSDLLA